MTNNITLDKVGLTNRLTESTGKVDTDEEPKQNLLYISMNQWSTENPKVSLHLVVQVCQVWYYCRVGNIMNILLLLQWVILAKWWLVDLCTYLDNLSILNLNLGYTWYYVKL